MKQNLKGLHYLRFMSMVFFDELMNNLPNSSGGQRKLWAQKIVDEKQDLETLCDLLNEEYKIASRFAWLLSDVGIYNNTSLFSLLPLLFEKRSSIKTFPFEESLIKYWTICFIPEEQEGEALNLLFENLNSPNTKVHIKGLVVSLLFKLSQKYPDIKAELVICLKEELDKNSEAFQKKAFKILEKLL